MTNVSTIKRVYYAYLGRLFWFTYQTQQRQIFGFLISSWLRFLTLILFLAAFAWNWGLPVWGASLLLLLYVWLSYWWAGKAGYMRFVPAKTELPLSESVPPLADGERVSLFASGVYAVAEREEQVLLRPSEYWRSPAGEHGVMVQHKERKYLYQFFGAETLEAVQAGWLIFGKEPLHTLSVSFWQTWGPDYDETESPYMIDDTKAESAKDKMRTIYFTFTDTAVEQHVQRTLGK